MQSHEISKLDVVHSHMFSVALSQSLIIPMASVLLVSYLKYFGLPPNATPRQTHAVEQSSNRQVVLTCHCEDHFVFFTNQQFVCALSDNPPLNPLLIFILNFS